MSPTTALMVWAPSAIVVVSTSARMPSAGSAEPSCAVTSNRTILVSTALWLLPQVPSPMYVVTWEPAG